MQVKAGAEKARKKKLKTAAVVGMTCCSAGGQLLDGQCFDIVVLDECSQIVEPLSLIPLRAGCRQEPFLPPHPPYREDKSKCLWSRQCHEDVLPKPFLTVQMCKWRVCYVYTTRSAPASPALFSHRRADAGLLC